MIKISYAKWFLIFEVVIGLAWLFSSYSKLNRSEPIYFYVVVNCILGIVTLFFVGQRLYRKYIVIDKRTIRINIFGRPLLNLSEIKEVVKEYNKFIVFTDKREITVYKWYLDKRSKQTLENEFLRLGIPVTEV